MTARQPWWRTLGDRRPLDPARRYARRVLARVFSRIAWRQRQRDAEPWIDLGGEG